MPGHSAISFASASTTGMDSSENAEPHAPPSWYCTQHKFSNANLFFQRFDIMYGMLLDLVAYRKTEYALQVYRLERFTASTM